MQGEGKFYPMYFKYLFKKLLFINEGPVNARRTFEGV